MLVVKFQFLAATSSCLWKLKFFLSMFDIKKKLKKIRFLYNNELYP